MKSEILQCELDNKKSEIFSLAHKNLFFLHGGKENLIMNFSFLPSSNFRDEIFRFSLLPPLNEEKNLQFNPARSSISTTFYIEENWSFSTAPTFHAEHLKSRSIIARRKTFSCCCNLVEQDEDIFWIESLPFSSNHQQQCSDFPPYQFFLLFSISIWACTQSTRTWGWNLKIMKSIYIHTAGKLCSLLPPLPLLHRLRVVSRHWN